MIIQKQSISLNTDPLRFCIYRGNKPFQHMNTTVISPVKTSNDKKMIARHKRNFKVS